MQLYGDNFSDAEIARWFTQEAAFHNQFDGGRYSSYSLKDDMINQDIAFKKYLKGGRILDFGCAEGLTLKRFLSERNITVEYHGIDSSDTLIRASILNNPSAKFQVIGCSEQIPYINNFFDFVIVCSVLHHIPNVTKTLEELIRVLKTAATFF